MLSENTHNYQLQVKWTGNTAEGTKNYTGYERSYEISHPGKPTLLGSSDPAYLGDASKYNPEEMLVAALSSCHMLWFLHLCAENGLRALSYQDTATGIMQKEVSQVNEQGVINVTAGHFVSVVLHPLVQLPDVANEQVARQLHELAHERCFIARSVNFPVQLLPRFAIEGL